MVRIGTTTNALGGQTVVVYDDVGNRTQSIDANGHATTFDYDSLYRVIATTDAENQTTTVTYDAAGNRQTVITDANGDVTRFDYNDIHQLTYINYPSGTADVTFTYDKVGNRLSMLDGTGNPSAQCLGPNSRRSYNF